MSFLFSRKSSQRFGELDPQVEYLSQSMYKLEEDLMVLGDQVGEFCQGAQALLVSGLKISEAMMLLFAPEPTMAMDAVKFRSIMSSIAIIDDAHTSVACVLSEKLKLEVLDPIAVNLDAINDLKGGIAALSGAYIDHSEFTEKIKKLRRNSKPQDPRLLKAEADYVISQSEYDILSQRIIESLTALNKHHFDILRGPYQAFKRCQHEFFRRTTESLTDSLASPQLVITPSSMTERPSYLSERISIQHGSKTPPLTPSRATSGGSDSFSRDAGRVEKVKDTTPSLPVPPLDRSKGPGPDEVVRIVPAGFPPKVKNKGGPSGGGTLQEMQSQPVVPILTKSSSSGSSTSAGTKKRDFFAPPRKKIDVGFLAMKICAGCGILIQKANPKFCGTCGYQFPVEDLPSPEIQSEDQTEPVAPLNEQGDVDPPTAPDGEGSGEAHQVIDIKIRDSTSFSDDPPSSYKVTSEPSLIASPHSLSPEDAITISSDSVSNPSHEVTQDVPPPAITTSTSTSYEHSNLPSAIVPLPPPSSTPTSTGGAFPIALVAPPRDSSGSKKKKKKKTKTKSEDADEEEKEKEVETTLPVEGGGGGGDDGSDAFPSCPTCSMKASKFEPKFCNGCGYKFPKKKKEESAPVVGEEEKEIAPPVSV